MLAACANIGSPDGGPYDETPPKVVGTHPAFAATNAKAGKIVIEFDENIKLDRPSEKVVVSPPQINQPEVSANGKRITIQLLDSLQPNTTYTIDFADAIEDNNEGNPMGDYAFTFSTGEQLDTFQVSGHVLNASDLEPIKGILVGLYAAGDSAAHALPDTVFRTRQLERISRTDSRGHFVIKGLDNKKKYQVYALQDMDQDYRFSQKNERIAFTDQLIQSSARPDLRPDTVWHDSIYYDSIVYTPYTHFYPDNIVLLAFSEEGQDRAYVKAERPQLEKFTLFFSAPDTVRPTLQPLNFSPASLVTEATPQNDTITYWLRDSIDYNQDTLATLVTYRATDTLGILRTQTDTLLIHSKVSVQKVRRQKAERWEEYAKEYRREYKKELRMKEQEEQQKAKEQDDGDAKKTNRKRSKDLKDEEIPVPPMPEEFLEARFSRSAIAPDQNIDIHFNIPIDTAYLSAVHFAEVLNDSERVERPFILRRKPQTHHDYRLYAEWQPEAKYELAVDTGAFVSIHGMRSPQSKRTITVKPLSDFGTLYVTLLNAHPTAIVTLLNSSGKAVKQQPATNGKADFYFLTPGTYYLTLYYDRDGNGQWTTGDYAAHRQPEETYFFPLPIKIPQGWEVAQQWNPAATPLPSQKPGKITKQKPDKEKTVQNKNEQRLKDKNRNKRRSNNNSSSSYGGGNLSF